MTYTIQINARKIDEKGNPEKEINGLEFSLKEKEDLDKVEKPVYRLIHGLIEQLDNQGEVE